MKRRKSLDRWKDTNLKVKERKKFEGKKDTCDVGKKGEERKEREIERGILENNEREMKNRKIRNKIDYLQRRA